MEDSCLREFRGYINDNLQYTFPLHWVDEIEWQNDGILVKYYDELDERNRIYNSVITEIKVTRISIK